MTRPSSCKATAANARRASSRGGCGGVSSRQSDRARVLGSSEADSCPRPIARVAWARSSSRRAPCLMRSSRARVCPTAASSEASSEISRIASAGLRGAPTTVALHALASGRPPSAGVPSARARRPSVPSSVEASHAASSLVAGSADGRGMAISTAERAPGGRIDRVRTRTRLGRWSGRTGAHLTRPSCNPAVDGAHRGVGLGLIFACHHGHAQRPSPERCRARLDVVVREGRQAHARAHGHDPGGVPRRKRAACDGEQPSVDLPGARQEHGPRVRDVDAVEGVGRERARRQIGQPAGMTLWRLARPGGAVCQNPEPVAAHERLDLGVRCTAGLQRGRHRRHGAAACIPGLSDGSAGRRQENPGLALAVLDARSRLDDRCVPRHRGAIDLRTDVRRRYRCGRPGVPRRCQADGQRHTHVIAGLRAAPRQ